MSDVRSVNKIWVHEVLITWQKKWAPWSAQRKGGRGSQAGPDWATNSRERASTEEVTFMSVPPWLLRNLSYIWVRHTIDKLQERKELREMPVSQRGEGVGSISRVEVTPSRDRVFSTGTLTFGLASRWSKIISQKSDNFEKHFSYFIKFGLRLVSKTWEIYL